MEFRPQPKAEPKTVTLSVTIPEAHHARLVEAGKAPGLTAEEVLAQFLAWAIDSQGLIAPKRRKSSKQSAK